MRLLPSLAAEAGTEGSAGTEGQAGTNEEAGIWRQTGSPTETGTETWTGTAGAAGRGLQEGIPLSIPGNGKLPLLPRQPTQYKPNQQPDQRPGLL